MKGKTMLRSLAIAALGLCLTFTHAGFPHQVPAFKTLPSSCFVTQTFDDGSKLADCPDTPELGLRSTYHTYVFDPDGQPYENDAGVPIRAAGFWYLV